MIASGGGPGVAPVCRTEPPRPGSGRPAGREKRGWKSVLPAHSLMGSRSCLTSCWYAPSRSASTVPA